MRNGLIRGFFCLDGIVNEVLSRIKPQTEANQENSEQKIAVPLKSIPEADKPLIKGLMAQLSDESNKAGRISADKDIQYLLGHYTTRGFDTTELEKEYLLRRQGLPYRRFGV